MQWTDDRLAWNASEYGGLSTIIVPAGPAQDNSEIWIPDIQLYNGEETIMNWEGPFEAFVDAEGSVFYSRPGMLRVLCKYSGLVAFPYDQLKAIIEFGSWNYPEAMMGLLPGPHKGASMILQIERLAIDGIRKSIHPTRT